MREFGYPQARRLDLTEDVLGYQVSDPYRWLEDDASDERAGWLAAQEELFAAQRAELPGRDDFAGQVRELLNVGYVGTPVWRGERFFFTRRDPGQEHGVLCSQLSDGPVQVLVDPAAKMVGLSVSRKKPRTMSFSSGPSGRPRVLAGLPVFR